MILPNMMNYGYYKELVEKGEQTIKTKDLNDSNIEEHFDNIIAILSDGIEHDEVRHLRIHVVFPNDKLDLFIIQYMYNLMFWTLIVSSGDQIRSEHLFFEESISKKNIKSYVDTFFIRRNMKNMDLMAINKNIDRCIGKFRELKRFQMYCCNTLDFKDTVDFMNMFPEFDKAIHFNIEGIPIEDVKEAGLRATNEMVKYITSDEYDHNSKYSFKAKEGTNIKQFKEVMVNIGSKPNGQNGGVFRHPIETSFVNGGLKTTEDIIIDSSIGRIAQILQKQNVGQSGAFARRLGLNNQNSRLHDDPEYICDSKNFQEVTITNKDTLEAFDMRYYRFTPNGMEYLLDATKDKELIGQTLLFRSPMTCASATRGHGVCYRCYGNLAYVNRNINIGQIAAESLSSIYTQRLLSAKHLLESAIIKLEWVPEFYQFFNVEFDQIILKDELEYNKMKIIINPDDIIENSDDADSDDDFIDGGGLAETNYICSFYVETANGERIAIRTNESDPDPIYITEEMEKILENAELNNDDEYELDMSKLKDVNLFMIDVQNDELSKVMKQVKNLIDNKASIKIHNRNSILEAFVEANLRGGIKINSVHFEIILMNQLRAENDILALPDWSKTNAPYQIITLENALVDNLSISVRLQAQKIKRNLVHSSNRLLSKASNIDLFYMEHPQDFMSKEFPEDTSEFARRKIIKPVIFNEKLIGTPYKG